MDGTAWEVTGDVAYKNTTKGGLTVFDNRDGGNVNVVYVRLPAGVSETEVEVVVRPRPKTTES